MTMLLVVFVGVVVRTPRRTAGSSRPPQFGSPALPLLLPGQWPPGTRLASVAERSAFADYRLRHAGPMKPDLMVISRWQVPGPPWAPAPRPPALADPDAVSSPAVSGNTSGFRELLPDPDPSVIACEERVLGSGYC